QGGGRGRPAAGAVRVGERGGVPPVPVDVHDDGGLGVGPGRRPAGGPVGLSLGRPGAAAQPRRQAASVAASTAGGGNPGGSTPWGDGVGNTGGCRTPAQLGRLIVRKSRKEQVPNTVASGRDAGTYRSTGP